MATPIKPERLPHSRSNGLMAPSRVRAFLDINPITLQRLREQGHLRAVSLLHSGRLRYFVEDVQRIIAAVDDDTPPHPRGAPPAS